MDEKGVMMWKNAHTEKFPELGNHAITAMSFLKDQDNYEYGLIILLNLTKNAN